jgi:NAD(P)H-nitrite reductase large subunit
MKDNQEITICRCEEVTQKEIKDSIKAGAKDVTGVKRRTRAGMGLCQGRTCELLVQRILSQELEEESKNLPTDTSRPPVRPISFDSLRKVEE